MYLAPDVFLIPDDGEQSHLLYAPLVGVLAHVNAGMATLVESLKRMDPAKVIVENAQERDALLQLGVISERPYPRLAPDSRTTDFKPRSVSLFLTSACNLGCTYCYASANEAPDSLSWELAEKAIDLVFENAKSSGDRSVSVILHGGGEASLEWKLLQQVVTYARSQSKTLEIGLNLSIGTNGVMSVSHANYIAENFDAATVSLDGPKDVHDVNRPTVGGHPSYDIVMRSLEIFDRIGLHYGLRMTITSDWVDRLPEAVSEICDRLAVHTIQAEPVFPVGRASRNELSSPNARRFIDAFRKAATIARQRGRALVYSGARLGEPRDRFCEAAGRSFAVTPSGDVSSCYEVSERKDSRQDVFFWGAYDEAQRRFVLDETRRRSQELLGIHGKSDCADCFCKWHCAGDCSAKLAALGDSRSTINNPRCEVNRALTKDQLVRALRHGASLEDTGGGVATPPRATPAADPRTGLQTIAAATSMGETV